MFQHCKLVLSFQERSIYPAPLKIAICLKIECSMQLSRISEVSLLRCCKPFVRPGFFQFSCKLTYVQLDKALHLWMCKRTQQDRFHTKPAPLLADIDSNQYRKQLLLMTLRGTDTLLGTCS